MLVAELRGKISAGAPPSDRSEDVLTSHVFSPLRYFGVVDALIEFLESARNLASEHLLLRPVERLETFFWPRVSLPDGSREPDVLLLLHHDGTRRTAIVVEAKYQSGPSDVERTDPDAAEKQFVGMSGDQLADHYLGLKNGQWRSFEDRTLPRLLTLTPADARRVLYVTAHYEPPADVMRRAIDAVRIRIGGEEAQLAEQCLFWVGWRELAAILGRSEAHGARTDLGLGSEGRLLEDLHEILRLRGLEPFQGMARKLTEVSQYARTLAQRETWRDLASVGEYQPFFVRR